jgi:hypothetical protein
MTPERWDVLHHAPTVQIYYDDRIQSVRFRTDPPPRSWLWVPQTDGWQSAYNSLTGLRLSVTDEAIKVRGFGPFRRLIEAFGLAKLSLPPRETTMRTVRLRRIAIGPWRAPWPQGDCVALSCKLPNEAEYTLAVRPSDGDFDRLRKALNTAGVQES